MFSRQLVKTRNTNIFPAKKQAKSRELMFKFIFGNKCLAKGYSRLPTQLFC